MSESLSPDSVVPSLPVLAIRGCEICRLDDDGVLEMIEASTALRGLGERPHLLCHGVFTAGTLRRLANAPPHGAIKAVENGHLDVMELIAFVRPAQLCRPTAGGIAQVLGLAPVASAEDAALVLAESAVLLLNELGGAARRDKRLARLVLTLRRNGWSWGELALEALSRHGTALSDIPQGSGLDIWRAVKPVEDRPPMPRPAANPLEPDEARAALAEALGEGAEHREGQGDYAAALAACLQPREEEGAAQILLAEAGTGIGKTLGYMAPAARWAACNGASIWLSTYTRNLQRQIDQEMARIFPDPAERAQKTVIRKGRENYLCLLNFEDMASHARGRVAVLAALMARWALHSRDGDMIGGDFPAWLPSLFMGARVFNEAGGNASAAWMGLTDRRGECIHSACLHYNRCFIERAARKTARAQVVIANHAFVMSRAAMEMPQVESADGKTDNADKKRARPKREIGSRIVFDEGHHVFEAADSAFSLHLTGLEMAELRRWLRGREAQRRRGRGLKERIGDLLGEDEAALKALDQALEAARALPAPGWPQRLEEGLPRRSGEVFLALARKQVLARARPTPHFSMETEVRPLIPELGEAALDLSRTLQAIAGPLGKLAKYLRAILNEKAGELETAERSRLEGAAIGIERRASVLPAWRAMLEALSGEVPDEFADWFALQRHLGREVDIGLHRHWIDPSLPFARAVLEEADAVVLTSATLRDRPPEVPEDWESAQMRTGANHLATPALRFSVDSPFDYAANSRVYIITDVTRTDADLVASAYRELFLASGGGALGLFTAIHRLRAIHARLVEPLLKAGLPLYAQHVDPLDTGTLVDIFRAGENACLLGTDALRDGVDVPGRSLRLVVFDRVPWPRAHILERARREAFGGNAWTDMTTRLKLAQGFGRLIRRRDDKGVFVMLDRQMPTRLTSAFPPDTPVVRIGLAEAVSEIHDFLKV